MTAVRVRLVKKSVYLPFRHYVFSITAGKNLCYRPEKAERLNKSITPIIPYLTRSVKCAGPRPEKLRRPQIFGSEYDEIRNL